MHNPDRSHWNVVKHVFRYLVGTKDYDILFGPNNTSGVVGYNDSNFAGCVDKLTVENRQPDTASNSTMEQSHGSRNFRSALLRQRPRSNM